MTPDIKKLWVKWFKDSTIVGNDPYFLKKEEFEAELTTLIKEILEDVDEKVVGKDDKQWWQVDDGYCGNCDFMPTDGSSDCKCLYRNNLRQQQRNALKDYKKGLGL